MLKGLWGEGIGQVRQVASTGFRSSKLELPLFQTKCHKKYKMRRAGVPFKRRPPFFRNISLPVLRDRVTVNLDIRQVHTALLGVAAVNHVHHHADIVVRVAI